MRKLNDKGSLVLPFVIVLMLFLASAGFGIWAFMGRSDYKNNSDQKSAAAVASAIKTEDAKKDAAFAEESKSPLKTYTGPSTYGSVSFSYPKTWSAYIAESNNSGALVDGYLSPDYVPNINSDQSFALRFQIIGSDYTTSMQSLANSFQQGTLKSSAYRAPKVSSVLGSYLTGQLSQKKSGSLVILPLRDKTLEIWTEGNDFTGDFTNTVLPSLNFIP